MNERIRAREVRLIDENGAQLGILPVREALRIARERELDLIEVAPNAQPPVCRILDYGKHRYQQAKREREAHRRSKPTEVRLLRLKPQIGPHDLEIKIKKLRELLGEGNKVRLQLRFRGRELSHPEMGTQLLNRIAGQLAEVAQVEMPARFEGRMMNMLLSPKPGVRPAAPARTGALPRPAPVRPPTAAPAGEIPVAAAPTEAAALAEAATAPMQGRAVSDGTEQVQQEQVERPLRSDEDAEDSGEAG